MKLKPEPISLSTRSSHAGTTAKSGFSARLSAPVLPVVLSLFTLSCDAGPLEPTPGVIKDRFESIAAIQSKKLNEVSGIQAISDNHFIVHNDDGKARVSVIDDQGAKVDNIRLRDGKQQEWEDITVIREGDRQILVIGEIGDNFSTRKSVRLYFTKAPEPDKNGTYPESLELVHQVDLRYPDGPRDAEALAWDSNEKQLLIATKRDIPPRLYTISLEKALSESKAELTFAGEMLNLRPPTMANILAHKKRGQWFSQPTGMDISPDGSLAAVITYRSLYIYQRQPGETWPAAFTNKPVEFLGPQGTHQEAVSFEVNGKSVIVTGERRPAFLFRLAVPEDLDTLSRDAD
jgi:hypothetical protein